MKDVPQDHAERAHVELGSTAPGAGNSDPEEGSASAPRSREKRTSGGRSRRVRSGRERSIRRQQKRGRLADWSTAEGYRKQYADELRALAARVHDDGRKATGARLRRLATRVELCGAIVRVAECSLCGGYQPESCKHRVRGRCRGRHCEVCSAREQQDRAQLYEALVRNVPVVAGYVWQALTITFARTRPASCGIPGPGHLETALVKLIGPSGRGGGGFRKTLWDAVRAQGAGLHLEVEIAASGMLHLHGLYYGPPLDQPALAELLADQLGAGQVDAQSLPRGGEALRRAARGWGRYVAKGGAREVTPEQVERHASRRRLRDKQVSREVLGICSMKKEVLSPKLAARFQLATLDRKLSQRYGAFRGIEVEQEKPKVEPRTQCYFCRAPAHIFFREVQVYTDCVLDEFHRERLPAFPSRDSRAGPHQAG